MIGMGILGVVICVQCEINGIVLELPFVKMLGGESFLYTWRGTEDQMLLFLVSMWLLVTLLCSCYISPQLFRISPPLSPHALSGLTYLAYCCCSRL
jgi:hypothetical protein